MSFPKTAGFRFGIAARLALGFAVVGLLAATANLVAERGATMVADAWKGPVSSAVQPALKAPLPIGTSGSPGASRQREPPRPDALLAAVADLQRATLAGVAADSTAVVDLGPSRRRLTVAVREFDRDATGIASTTVRGGIRNAAAEAAKQAEAAIAQGAQRRVHAGAYLSRLDAMSERIDEAVAGSLKLFGRVIARQHLVELRSAIANLQVPAGRLAAATHSSADLDASARAEAEVARLIKANEQRLARAQGNEWFAAMRSDLAALESDRTAIAAAAAAQSAALGQLRAAAEGIGRQVAGWQQSLADARAAPPALSGLPAALAPRIEPVAAAPDLVRQRQVEAAQQQTRRLQQLIRWFTVALLAVSLLISVGTVASIVHPVRNLLRATARVAAGEAQVVVPRGGVAELDTLAGAFNTMAEEVEKARRDAERYRNELERRVEERTRQLQYQAFHDPLTQLPNRRQFFELLRAAIESAARNQQLVAVYFLDLDNFKHVNDGTGHEFGDRLLVASAERLREAVAGQGVAARFGGDEFTVVSSGLADEAAAQAFGERLVGAFQRPVIVDGREVLVGVSVGAALYPHHHDAPEALLRAADTALYRAKQLGRNRFAPYTPELLAAASVRFATEQQLRRAIEAGELELLYQPEVRSDGFGVRMVEALLRWRQADGTVVMPDVFLPVAEESGLIMEISEWVFRTAMADCARWRAGLWPEACVAVNVSARQLYDHRFAARVLEMLMEHGLPTDAIELELTETVLQTGAPTVAALRRLRELGIAIALDDFGTGYSSLTSLDQLPINRVKLDRSLIAELDGSPRSAAIVSATLQLCRDFGLEVTAEGVERPRQFVSLLRFQPLLLQGFLLSRPVPAAKVEETVRGLPAFATSLLLEAGGAQGAAPVVNLFPSPRQRSK